mgnify:CR=1 FL=1
MSIDEPSFSITPQQRAELEKLQQALLQELDRWNEHFADLPGAKYPTDAAELFTLLGYAGLSPQDLKAAGTWTWWELLAFVAGRLEKQRLDLLSRNQEPQPARPQVTDQAMVKLFALYVTKAKGKELERVSNVIRDRGKSVNERLEAWDEILPIPEDVPSRSLAEILEVEESSIRKTPWWLRRSEAKRAREAEEIEERRRRLRERGRHLD